MRHIEPLRFGRPETTWKPTPLPELQPGEPIGLDFEYKPNDDPTRCKPISFAVYSPRRGEGWYVPWAHEGGGNIDEAAAKRWYTDQVKDRDIYGLNMKAEAHSSFNWGVDPNDQNWRPHDVAFAATLLNENRYKGFSLAALAEEYLPADERKIQVETASPQQFYLTHAGEVAPRCISDSYLAWRIHEVTRKQIEAEGLERVNQVEDDCILPVVGMERSGMLIDRPKLERWLVEIDQTIEQRFKQVYDLTGVQMQTDGPKAWEALFAQRGLDKPSVFNEMTKVNEESWSRDGIKGIKDPAVQAAFDLRRFRSLKSKYFSKYIQAIDSNNILRFPLHQLRSTNEFGADDDSGYGTVTGRFSCGGNEHKVNIQQVSKCEKQIEELGPDFIVRELMIAAPGKSCFASDASQIEFRLFSHYAAVMGYRGTADAYKANPMEDFHLLVTRLMNPGISDKAKLKSLRKNFKHNNFGVLYGMGRPKLARRLSLPCSCLVDWNERNLDDYWISRSGEKVYKKLRHFGENNDHALGCPARKANNIMDEYDREFPEARTLLKRASDRAKERGYVTDIIDRRRRYPDGQGLHGALNSVIQPSAASYFKIKLAELHRERKTIQIEMRAPVHDEVVGDISPDPKQHGMLQELLDTQSLPLKVPLLWQSGFGANWAEANS